MRIGIDGRLWNETGVGRYIRNLVWHLQTLDTQNEYVLFVQPKHLRKKAFSFNPENTPWKIVEVDIRWHSVAEQLKFPKIIEKEQLDIMHFPYFSLPILYKKPFVVTIHDLIINHFPTGKASTLSSPMYKAKRFGYQAVMKHAIKQSKTIMVPLHAVEIDLMKTLHVPQEKIVVTEEGVDLLYPKRTTQSHKKEIAARPSVARNDGSYFLYVGNAYPHKNVDLLVDTFISFQQEHPEAQLLFVGKDDYFYKQLEERMRVEKRKGITFKHDVTDSELFSYYANAKAFISASLMEGFGLPPLEALSASCPVLLSDIPSFREVCGKAAYYFDPHDAQDLKAKMSFMYNLSQKERATLREKGLDRVKAFSWKKMAQETKAVYESSISI